MLAIPILVCFRRRCRSDLTIGQWKYRLGHTGMFTGPFSVTRPAKFLTQPDPTRTTHDNAKSWIFTIQY